MIFKYQTREDALRKLIPDILYPNPENIVYVQFVHTKSTGLGDYDKLDVLVPVQDKNGKEYMFGIMSFLNSSAPITAGREIYGQPQKFGQPSFRVERDTVVGELDYCGVRVATGTLSYKSKRMDIEEAKRFLSIPHLDLKLIPNVSGSPEIAQLVEIQHENVHVQSAYESSARMELFAHANAPMSDLPVVKMLNGFNIVGDLELPAGKVVHDFLKE